MPFREFAAWHGTNKHTMNTAIACHPSFQASLARQRRLHRKRARVASVGLFRDTQCFPFSTNPNRQMAREPVVVSPFD